jgi:uncharacterized membrane protein YidH (DUF202 family)
MERSEPTAESGFVDIAAGALFLTLGITALWIGSGYDPGNATDMGPGYFPRLIGWALIALGIATALRGILRGGWARPYWAARPLLVLSVALLVFGFSIDRFGLFVAGAVTVVAASFAQRSPRWRQVVATAFGLAAFCTILFGYALNLSLPMWPR